MTIEMVEKRYAQARAIGRVVANLLGLAVIVMLSAAFATWLTIEKMMLLQGSTAIVAAPAPRATEEDAERQRITNQIQSLKVQIINEKRRSANLEAQIKSLTKNVKSEEMQLDALREAAKATPPPLSTQQMLEKTHELFGVSGKVVTR